MAIRLQPQRVPFGAVTTADGKPVQIGGQNAILYISREWYRQLEQIAAAVEAGGGDGDQPDEGIEPYAWAGGDVSARGDDDVAVGPDMSAVPAVLLEHGQGLQAFAVDEVVSSLRATVEALEKRIEALEQGTTP